MDSRISSFDLKISGRLWAVWGCLGLSWAVLGSPSNQCRILGLLMGWSGKGVSIHAMLGQIAVSRKL